MKRPVRNDYKSFESVASMKEMITAICLSLLGTSAMALETLTQRPEFVNAVAGHILEIPLLRIQLRVADTGEIAGKGFGRDVTGTWEWADGFFCRSMTWGERELEYNCQQVATDGSSLIFISDKGTGRSAKFALRPATP
jgi:hypothetical protein